MLWAGQEQGKSRPELRSYGRLGIVSYDDTRLTAAANSEPSPREAHGAQPLSRGCEARHPCSTCVILPLVPPMIEFTCLGLSISLPSLVFRLLAVTALFQQHRTTSCYLLSRDTRIACLQNIRCLLISNITKEAQYLETKRALHLIVTQWPRFHRPHVMMPGRPWSDADRNKMMLESNPASALEILSADYWTSAMAT
jgi:hypothetical protein